jgi:hypothetical protein
MRLKRLAFYRIQTENPARTRVECGNYQTNLRDFFCINQITLDCEPFLITSALQADGVPAIASPWVSAVTPNSSARGQVNIAYPSGEHA